jgi:hypothetical protein
MAENTNIALTVEAWAKITVEKWIKKMDALGVGSSKGSTGALKNSFVSTVFTESGGDPSRIQFAFEWYGKMVDYGVGNGVSIGNRDTMLASGQTKREKKPWFQALYKELEILRHLLEEKNALKVERFLIQKFEEKTES